MQKNSYRVVGMMSGTSLDGLDICMVQFIEENGKWKYEIKQAETLSYSEAWIQRLKNAEKTSGEVLQNFHRAYGTYLGECVKSFLQKNNFEKPLFIASHGHTIFHQPEIGYTFQAGSGAHLQEACGIPVICDFRSLDVSLGGQGAPLVPIGDALLFGEYDNCLNLGGIANVSFDEKGVRKAYDICAVNYVFNRLSNRLNKEFDKGGEFAKSGNFIPEIFEKLNGLAYFNKLPPKSIGREWIEESIFPLLPQTFKTEDLLRTFSEHVALQISKTIQGEGKTLVTGGGALNSYLISILKLKCKSEIILPNEETINFKEALIFAFLGLLRCQNKINTLKSVTGAREDSSGGVIFN